MVFCRLRLTLLIAKTCFIHGINAVVLNKTINDVMSRIKTRDLIILDEPTDGFSNEQLDKVRDVLEQLNMKQVIIVSHESKVESFVNSVVRIEKREHVSCVV